jgi:hypothetical protein
MRKDGRPLITEHPVTAMDMIDYVNDVEIPKGGFGCALDLDPEYDDGWEYDSA